MITFIVYITSHIKMKLSDILLTTLNQTPSIRQHSINNSFLEIKKSMFEAQQAQESVKDQKEKQFLKIYVNVLDRMSNQLKIAKQKYQTLDKQKLKQQKCLGLAENIKIFREECYLLRQRLDNAKKQLRKEKAKESALFCQKTAMEKLFKRKKTRAKSQKASFNGIKSFLDDMIRPETEKKFQRNKIYSIMKPDLIQRPKTTFIENERKEDLLKSHKRFSLEYHKKNNKKRNGTLKQTNNTLSIL